MYSGTTLTKFSGRVMGAHQKIDRVSRRHLKLLMPGDKAFPKISAILQFEGRDGPDGIKRKSPAHNEPWHYYDPFDETDTQLLTLIEGHHTQLVHELRFGSGERAAFEAAWLAHAIVDGLTPAHHYPYESELSKLRQGSKQDRTTIRKKIIIPGETVTEVIGNNWKMWGGKGLMTTHGTFEWGVASMLKPLKLTEALPSAADVELLCDTGIVAIFKRAAHEIALLDMYGRYYRKGWTPRLAHQVRTFLAPTIVKTVTLAWHGALLDAMQITRSRPVGAILVMPPELAQKPVKEGENT